MCLPYQQESYKTLVGLICQDACGGQCSGNTQWSSSEIFPNCYWFQHSSQNLDSVNLSHWGKKSRCTISISNTDHWFDVIFSFSLSLGIYLLLKILVCRLDQCPWIKLISLAHYGKNPPKFANGSDSSEPFKKISL